MNRVGIAELPYRETWSLDFEYHAPAGERPDPICMVARELRSGRLLRVWQDELKSMARPPFAVDETCLLVAYNLTAELGYFLVLGWPMPKRSLDLYVEFRRITCGRHRPNGAGLLAALGWFGLDSMAGEEKGELRDLAIRGGPFTDEERIALLDYCQTDVDALDRLLPAMLPGILSASPDRTREWAQAVYRARYMAAVARMQHYGVPIDINTLALLQSRWRDIRASLIAEVDRAFGVYEGTTFKTERFLSYLSRNRIPWPQLESGAPDLQEITFRDMAKAYPQLQPLRELRHALGQMRLSDLAVGSDGRNRVSLFPFGSKTSRNQPSNSRFIFGPSAWLRSLIRPDPGMAIAYVDFTAQEMGVAAALSGDPALLEAYATGDIYLAFAKQAGLAPPDATKKTHKEVRDLCKAVVLGTLYGMGPDSLAMRIGKPAIYARQLLRKHREVYPRFWKWSDETVATATLRGRIRTVFGWTQRVGEEFNPRSLMNFPMQANGAEILRLSCCLATERGIRVCAPIHDALLIEAPVHEIDCEVWRLQECLREASRIVLGGFELGSDAEVFCYPDRYVDGRGKSMWELTVCLASEVAR